MSKINLGQNASFDTEVLIRTRLLIQANSGGGKSYLLRRLLEQAFGHVQCIVIDPEGEFSTLREKYGYVLIGHGGEAPVDVRTAELTAETLLELQASAICDLYEMKPDERHQWVANFLGGLMNAKKELWHPVLVVVDEAHKFCPERGKGESVAKENMVMLATAGRKRGFCAAFATQRLGKLDKDAAAELLNVCIGRTWLDIDRDRAAEILGVNKTNKAKFFEEIRQLEPGQFHILGPAISTEPRLVKVGAVSTTHAEAGSSLSSQAPPTPDQVKPLLSKLAEIPQVAEKKLKTIEDLNSRIHELENEVNRLETDAQFVPEPVDTEEVYQRGLMDGQRDVREASERLYAQGKKEGWLEGTKMLRELALEALNTKLPEPIIVMAGNLAPLPPVAEDAVEHFERTSRESAVAAVPFAGGMAVFSQNKMGLYGHHDFPTAEDIQLANRMATKPKAPANGAGGGPLSSSQVKVVHCLKELAVVGFKSVPKPMLAGWCGVSPTSGGYFNNLGRLRASGYVEYQDSRVYLTQPVTSWIRGEYSVPIVCRWSSESLIS
jgi:hypothetical protein